MNRVFATVLCLINVGLMHAQELSDIVERDREGKAFRVLSYNVENLFDTIADGTNNDEEFLPSSEKNYNTVKYSHKIGNLAKVIRSVGGWQAPELVGLIEVENRGVLIDLINHEALKKANYHIAHYDSPDPRGIDVALLYNSELFKLIQLQRLEINEERMRTRDILFVTLLVNEQDTLHVFVNHWSSRRGGKDKSSYKREIAASKLKTHTDSLFEFSTNSNVIIMGDFNDSPVDKSISILMNEDDSTSPLFNTSADLGENAGTYKYRGVWDVIDQIIVSANMTHKTGSLSVLDGRAYIFDEPFCWLKMISMETIIQSAVGRVIFTMVALVTICLFSLIFSLKNDTCR